jgi:hypothetical protein
MQHTTCRPGIEELEPRDAPSTTHLPFNPPRSAASVVRRSAPPTPLVGTLTGTFTQTRHGGDTGASYALTGRGSVRPLGSVTLKGSMTATGFVRVGRAGGALTLTSHGGALTLRLLGPDQGGSQPLPIRFHFTAGGGTGVYRHLTGSGIALLMLTPPPIRHPTAGAFTLTLEIQRV